MFLRGFEINVIKTDEMFFKAEEFVDTLDPHSLDDDEKKLFTILLELMEHYDEKFVVPKYLHF